MVMQFFATLVKVLLGASFCSTINPLQSNGICLDCSQKSCQGYPLRSGKEQDVVPTLSATLEQALNGFSRRSV